MVLRTQRNSKREGETRDNIKRAVEKQCKREYTLHDQIIFHCDTQWPRWKYIRARPDQKSTIAKGAQDFTIFLPGGKTAKIEVKAKDGKPSDDQQIWAAEMKMLGHEVHIVRSFDEFLEKTKP